MNYIKIFITYVRKVPIFVWVLLLFSICIFAAVRLGYVGNGIDQISNLLSQRHDLVIKNLENQLKSTDEKIKILEKDKIRVDKALANNLKETAKIKADTLKIQKEVQNVGEKIKNITIPDTIGGITSEFRKRGYKPTIVRPGK